MRAEPCIYQHDRVFVLGYLRPIGRIAETCARTRWNAAQVLRRERLLGLFAGVVIVWVCRL